MPRLVWKHFRFVPGLDCISRTIQFGRINNSLHDLKVVNTFVNLLRGGKVMGQLQHVLRQGEAQVARTRQNSERPYRLRAGQTCMRFNTKPLLRPNEDKQRTHTSNTRSNR